MSKGAVAVVRVTGIPPRKVVSGQGRGQVAGRRLRPVTDSQVDLLPPPRDVHAEAEGLDLRGDRELRVGIAVHEEHRARVTGISGLPPLPEVRDPVEQL